MHPPTEAHTLISFKVASLYSKKIEDYVSRLKEEKDLCHKIVSNLKENVLLYSKNLEEQAAYLRLGSAMTNRRVKELDQICYFVKTALKNN